MKLAPMPNSVLQRDFARYAAGGDAPAHVKPIEKILLVGGSFDEGGYFMVDRDERYLGRALKCLHEAGVPLSPKFEVAIANLDPYNGGEDFLQDNFEADLVGINFIYNPEDWEEADRESEYTGGRPELLISPLHFEEGIWLRSALRTGARAIHVVGNTQKEIHEGYFVGEDSPYQPVPESQGTIKLYYIHPNPAVGRVATETPASLLLHTDLAREINAPKAAPSSPPALRA